MAFRAIVSAAALFALAGCASGPGIPDTNYFRLPEPAAVERMQQPLFEVPVVVGTLQADGVHSGQAVLYATDPDGRRLRAYHYQLWADPPVRMLQRRLISLLRRSGVAPLVVDRLPPEDSVRISGRIEAFERVPGVEGWDVVVAIALRADRGDRTRPLHVRMYRARHSVRGDRLVDSTDAFGAAVDEIFARFLDDVAKAVASGR